jgi:hypothetical protein
LFAFISPHLFYEFGEVWMLGETVVKQFFETFFYGKVGLGVDNA